MSNFLIDYTTYMRSLAAQHRELNHTAEEKHFFRGELQEFWQQFRSDVRFPCLIAESCDMKYTGEKGRLFKERSTSFIVADKYDQHDDYDEIQLKMSKCERIAEEILAKIISEDDAFIASRMDEGTGQYLMNEADRYVGYRMDFKIIEQVCVNLSTAFSNEEN